MATIKDIFDIEKQRQQPDQWNVIHLFKEGNTYKAYEWSAWLTREFASTEEWRSQFNAHQLKPVHKMVKKTSGSIIFVGFPPTSLDKFVQRDLQLNFVSVSDTQIDITIELPADIGELSYESLNEGFLEWKKQFQLKQDKPDEDNNRQSNDQNESILPYQLGKPMRMSAIVLQLAALPLEDISPSEALNLLKKLKRQALSIY